LFGVKVLQYGVAIVEVFLQFHKILVCNGLQRVGICCHLLFQVVDFLNGGLGLMGAAEHHGAGEDCDACESGLSHVFVLCAQRYAICWNHTKKPDCICGDSRDSVYEYEFSYSVISATTGTMFT